MGVLSVVLAVAAVPAFAVHPVLGVGVLVLAFLASTRMRGPR